MSKKVQKNKKLEQPAPLVPSADLYQPKKIRPQACLLLRAYTAKSQNDYLDFRVKRSYYRQLDLSLPDRRRSREPDTTVSQLYQVYSKMKYLYRLQIKDFYSKKWDLFYRTKLRRIREVKIVSHSSYSFGPVGDQIKHFAKDFKRLKRLSLQSLKFLIRQTFFLSSETFSTLFTYIISVLKGMINLKEFSLIIKRPTYGEQNFAKSISLKELDIKDNSSKFKKLQKLEKLSLVFQALPRLLLDSFSKDFSYLKNLKSIKLAAEDENHGKEIVENLCKMKSLTSVTIHQFAEPNNILSLALEIPNLRSINIKDDWIFSSKDMPALQLIKHKGLDITRLHIDVPLDIESNDDVDFMVNFLTPFKEVRSLSLYIRSSEGKYILHPIAKSVNSLHKLEKLKLGLHERLVGTSSKFLSCLESLAELKEITLLLKRESQPTSDIKETYQALRTFLLQSPKLKNVVIDWNKFTEECAGNLKLTFKEITDLDMFKLSFLMPSRGHGTKHENILRSLKNLLGSTTTRIKRVTLATVCENCGEDEPFGCPETLRKLTKVVESNKNIGKLVFEVVPPKFL